MLRAVVNNAKPDKSVDTKQTEARTNSRQHPWRRLVARVVVFLLFLIALFLILLAIWWGIRWAQHRGHFKWVPEWLFLPSGLSAPVATLLASGGVIGAAGIAFWNGERTRAEERNKWAEAKKQETVRSLRDRYFHITELLSDHSSYAQREAAVYSLAALSDDWASFYGDGTEAAAREQQTCLNVIAGQLRDPLPAEDDEETKKEAELIVFKQRVQGVITERYRPSISSEQSTWSHLDLDLSFCHLYEPDFTSCAFAGKVRFTSANFIRSSTFEGAKFTGLVTFSGAKFGGVSAFRAALFGDHTSFLNAKFGGVSDFRAATFGDHTSFLNAKFGGVSDFRAATFGGNTNFFGVEFGGYSIFRAATFGGNTVFVGAEFGNNSSFAAAEFGNNSSFAAAEFGGESDFQAAKFRDDIDFKRATFGGIANFTGAKFLARQTRDHRQTTNFARKRAKLEKRSSFNGPSQFTQLPNFKGTQFPTCPPLTDDSDPRDFFAGAIFLDEQDAKEG